MLQITSLDKCNFEDAEKPKCLDLRLQIGMGKRDTWICFLSIGHRLETRNMETEQLWVLHHDRKV